jgi:uncharacterized membrane-anchored protein
MKITIWPFFLLMVLIQWVVPGQMILQKEMVLHKGTSYKFRTAPVDPIDPFIGRYIILNFSEQSYDLPRGQKLDQDKPVFVTFKPNTSGFAEIDKITVTEPERNDYLRTHISRIEEENDRLSVIINYPFTRFYMEESKAPEAEIIYGAGITDSLSKVYALVSLYKGDAAIKNVYINATTITDMLKRRQMVKGD